MKFWSCLNFLYLWYSIGKFKRHKSYIKTVMHFSDGIHLDPPIWYEDFFKIKTSEQTVAKEKKSYLNVFF